MAGFRAGRAWLLAPARADFVFSSITEGVEMVMQWKAGVFALAALVMAAGPAWAACSPNDKIDGSTAADAKKAIEAAGYEQVRVEKKGCDNYWHGTARKDGAAVNVVLSPDGQVYLEGN
jgi:hypothetical protein